MKKILVVEGLCCWNIQVERMLADEGFRVRTTRTLISAQHLVNREQPDLVIIGLGIQPQNGWHLLRKLKAENSDLPVLVHHVVSTQTLQDLKRTVTAAMGEIRKIHINSARHYLSHRHPESMPATV